MFEFDNKIEALDKEIELISDLSPEYNIHQGGLGGAMYGDKNGMYGKTHTPEWIENKRNAMLGHNNPMYGKTHSEEIKNKQSLKMIGNIPWNKGKLNIYSDETLIKMKLPKSEEHKNKIKKTYEFISPENIKTIVFGLSEFCKNNNLNKGAMSEVWSGKRNSHKGWKK